EATLEQLIRRHQLATEVARQQQPRDRDASDEVTGGELEEPEVARVRSRGDADECERTGFRRNDGEADRPPGQLAAGEEVVARAALRAAQPRTKGRYADDVGDEDDDVQSGKCCVHDVSQDRGSMTSTRRSTGMSMM